MALGRGIKALIPEIDLLNEDQPRSLENINPKDIIPNPDQVRKVFDQNKIEELAKSIDSYGIIEPIVVKRENNKFIIIAGERRWRAANFLGLEEIPAVVIKEPDNFLELSIIENLQREDLNPIELAHGYADLIEDYNYTHDSLAKRFGISRSNITNILRLLKLPEEIQDLIVENKLSYGVARLLLGVKEPRTQLDIAHKAVKNDLSVREVQSLIKEDKPKVKKVKPQETNPYIEDIQNYLSNFFDTKVNVKEKNNKGKIEIKFDSLDKLNKILDLVDYVG